MPTKVMSHLSSKGRKAAQAYYRVYREIIPVAMLVRELAAVMQWMDDMQKKLKRNEFTLDDLTEIVCEMYSLDTNVAERLTLHYITHARQRGGGGFTKKTVRIIDGDEQVMFFRTIINEHGEERTIEPDDLQLSLLFRHQMFYLLFIIMIFHILHAICVNIVVLKLIVYF